MTRAFSTAINRRSFLGAGSAAAVTAIAGVPAMTAFTGVAQAKSSAENLLKKAITIDTHSHPGPFYKDMKTLSPALDKIKKSHLTGFAYSVVTDLPIMEKRGKLKRKPRKGELHEYVVSQLNKGTSIMGESGIKAALNTADIVAAKQAGTQTAILAIEGGGFAEGRLEAIQEVYDLGARIIQPVHYNYYNPFGDIQGKSSKGGLTAEGAAFAKELARLGIVLDAAHMTYEGVKKVADAYGGPLLLSHVMYPPKKVKTKKFTRWASPGHAKTIVETGGLLGVWNLGGSKMAKTLGYRSSRDLTVLTFKYLADKYGVDHVCLGSDLDSTKGWFGSYQDLPKLVEALQDTGFNDEEITKMLGGNVMKLFKKVTT